MKLPRDVSGAEFSKAVAREFGYRAIRQKGSHLRMETTELGVHRITVPMHDFIRPGTLGGLLEEIATHFGLDEESLIVRLKL